MLATATAAGLLLGWLRGGTFSTLGGFTPRIPWVIPLAFAGQYVIARGTGDDVAWWVLPLHMGSYCVLLAGIVANRDVQGTSLLTAGLVFNALAIGANGGLMPLAPEHL